MKARPRYKPKTQQNSTFGLNITSMTDMFTIMLVFLLQTYSSNPVEIEIEKGIRLPSSTSENSPTEALKVSLTKDALIIDGKIVAKIQDQDFLKQDIDSNDSNFILPFFRELEKYSQMKDKKYIEEGRIVMQADSSFNYGTLRKVMYTASMAGFPKLKLATVVGN